MPLQFSEEIFDAWNNTTSVVTLPAKIVGQDKPAVVRNDLIFGHWGRIFGGLPSATQIASADPI